VETVLLDLERRGNAFFEDTLRLGRILDLLNRERIRDQFEQKVVADLPRVVEKRVDEIVEWMVASELKQFRAISELLRGRQAAHAERMVGHVSGAFESDRVRLLENVRRHAQRAVESFDHAEEARRLAASVRDIVAGAALLQVGAIGLGAVVTALATTTPRRRHRRDGGWRARSWACCCCPRGGRPHTTAAHQGGGHARDADGHALQQLRTGAERSRGRILEAIGPTAAFVALRRRAPRGQRGEPPPCARAEAEGADRVSEERLHPRRHAGRLPCVSAAAPRPPGGRSRPLRREPVCHRSQRPRLSCFEALPGWQAACCPETRGAG
jgi:hypothetical protein